MEASIRNQRVHFGAFAADLRSGELYKNGIRLRLQKQPFEVLKLLLERPGDVVTREELRQKLWPADTFVDFDAGLNSAIESCAMRLTIKRKHRDTWRLYRGEDIASSFRLRTGRPRRCGRKALYPPPMGKRMV